MKYYEQYYEVESRALDFCKGWHSLKEWCDFGFNVIVYKGARYWDGLKDGMDQFEDVPDLELDCWDIDEDGYKIIYLRDGRKD